MNIYNTLSRGVEEFRPIKGREVNVYICGLTVYDYMHIGHARTYMAFDAILRYLAYRGYKVNYVQNVTDVDDKIIKRAKEAGRDPKELTSEFHKKSMEDQQALGLLMPDEFPKVTENITGIIDAVANLIKKGFAYEVEGSVYFDVSKADDYGKLSNQNEKQLKRHRIEPNPNKKNPLDFALWKSVDAQEYGFDSPWGYGRPGWHIECSVLSCKFLGDQLDIHGGATDLIFPHHENEIAQSEALTGKKPFVKYWMHTGFLQSSGEKMSKSLGNILPVREFLKEFSADAFRLFVLQAHYRSPIDYSRGNIEDAQKTLERLKEFRRRLQSAVYGNDSKAKEAADVLKARFVGSMDNDFNTPKALSELFDFVREVNSLMDSGSQSKGSLDYALKIFDELIDVLGLHLEDITELSPEDAELIKQREEYRKEKNWAKSDEIRGQLAKKGLKLIDNKDGSTRVIKELHPTK